MGLFGLLRRNRKGIGIVPVLIVVAIVAVIAIVMMMKKGGEEGSAALPGGVSFSSKPAVSQVSSESMPAILPAETVAYYTVQNFEEQWKAVTGSNFWKKITALPFWAGMNIDQTVETFKKDLEEGLGFEITESRVFELVGKEFAFAVIPSADANDTTPQVFFLMRTGLKSKVASTIAELMNTQQGNPRLTKTTHNGTDIVFVPPENAGDPEVRYCFAGDILTFGIGNTEDSLKKMIDLAKSGKSADALVSNKNFKEMLSLVGSQKGENLLGLFFVDMQKVAASLDGLNIMGDNGQVNFTDNLKSLKMIGGRIYGKNEICANILVVPDTENMSADAAKLWDVAPQSSESLGIVPSGTLIFSASSALDVMGMWKTWVKGVNNAEAGQAMTAAISDFEKQNNINIEKDVLSWVGSEASFVFANVDVTGMFPVPELAVAVKVKDQAGAEAFMGKMVDLLNSSLSSLGEGMQVEMTDRAYGSTNMKVLQIPVAVPGLMPGYMFQNGFLVISSSAKVMERMVDTAAGKSASVSKDANYKILDSVLPAKSNQMAYVNLESFLSSVVEVLRWVIQFQNMQAGGEEGAGSEQAALLEQQVVPAIEVFKTFKSIGMSTVYSDKGIEQKVKISIDDK